MQSTHERIITIPYKNFPILLYQLFFIFDYNFRLYTIMSATTYSLIIPLSTSASAKILYMIRLCFPCCPAIHYWDTLSLFEISHTDMYYLLHRLRRNRYGKSARMGRLTYSCTEFCKQFLHTSTPFEDISYSRVSNPA